MIDRPENMAGAWKRGAIIAAGFVFATMLGATLLRSSAVHAQLESWKLIPTPEAYTELYFNNNVALPTAMVRPVRFSIGIKNVEGQTTSYPYLVTLISTNGGVIPVAMGTVTLTNGSTATLPEVVKAPAGMTTAEISVELPSQNQEIHFWLGKTQ